MTKFRQKEISRIGQNVAKIFRLAISLNTPTKEWLSKKINKTIDKEKSSFTPLKYICSDIKSPFDIAIIQDFYFSPLSDEDSIIKIYSK